MRLSAASRPVERETRPLSSLRMWQRSFRQGDVGAVHLSIQRWGFNGAPRVWQDPTASAGEPATVVVGKHTLLSPLHMRDEGCEPPEHKEVDADGD